MVDQSTRLDPQTLALWLEWAAVRLIAMPTRGLRPSSYRTYWPDVPWEPLAGTMDREFNRIRALAPSSSEIPIVDLILPLPNLSTHEDTRKIIHWRAQVHPLSRRHLLTWDWIAKKLGTKKYTVQQWYRLGLEEVANKTPTETVCRIAAFMDDHL